MYLNVLSIKLQFNTGLIKKQSIIEWLYHIKFFLKEIYGDYIPYYAINQKKLEEIKRIYQKKKDFCPQMSNIYYIGVFFDLKLKDGEMTMMITDVRMRKISQEGKMKAIVSVTFDNEFVVHDIKVIDGQNGLFVAMPSRKMGDGDFRDIAHPINSETREKIQDAIFEEYKKSLAEEKELQLAKEEQAEEKEEVAEEKAEEKEEVVVEVEE